MNWTPQAVEYLKANYRLQPVDETARHLGTTRYSIAGKAWRLGLCDKKVKRDMAYKGSQQLANARKNSLTLSRPEPVKHTPEPIDIFAKPAPKPAGGPVDILGLSAEVCAFPISDKMFCGQPVTTDSKHPSSYCTEHHAICWIPKSSLNDRKRVKA